MWASIDFYYDDEDEDATNVSLIKKSIRDATNPLSLTNSE